MYKHTYKGTYVIHTDIEFYHICIYVHTYVYNYAWIFTDTYLLKNCNIKSPSIGTIRISCDIPHQILVTVKCNRNYGYCNNPMVTSNGNSPITVKGLDPGVTYSVTVDVFDGNQVGLTTQTVRETIRVKSGMYIVS